MTCRPLSRAKQIVAGMARSPKDAHWLGATVWPLGDKQCFGCDAPQTTMSMAGSLQSLGPALLMARGWVARLAFEVEACHCIEVLGEAV